MGKKKDQARAKKDARRSAKGAHDGRAGASASAVAVADAQAGGRPADRPKMSAKAFESELERLQIELVKLQEWVKATGAKVCVLFEGRDAAGKGGIIKRLTERTSPRVFRVVALPAPTEREKSQMYVQRYLPHLPAAGEIILFDRSWYNRAGVERVMGFTPRRRWRPSCGLPPVERVIIASGVRLIKYWLEVSMEHQTERFEERIHDGRKIWKLSPMDLEAHRAGTTSRAPATPCSRPPTRPRAPGTWWTPTTSAGCA